MAKDIITPVRAPLSVTAMADSVRETRFYLFSLAEIDEQFFSELGSLAYFLNFFSVGDQLKCLRWIACLL